MTNARDSGMRKIAAGAAAGFAATVPMTVAMELLHRGLPRRQRYPLAPRLITERLTHEAGVRGEMDEDETTAATLAAHFGYGAATGALYGAVADTVDAPPVAKGVAWGLIVWVGSYLGLLPALGLLRPATRHPAPRNALMIAAHAVWGAALGAATSAVGADGKARAHRLHPRRSRRR